MTFEKWLQSRLVAHGFDIKIDGRIGPATKQAIRDFQRKKRLAVTGSANDETVEKLRGASKKVGEKKRQLKRSASMPPYIAEATRRMGLHERTDNGTLSRFMRKYGKFLGNPANLPWCGDFVESCILATLDEKVPDNPFWARAWAGFGIDAGGPKVGSIGVIGWKRGGGHVGFVVDYDHKRQRVKLRGGNQRNSVNDSWFALNGRSGKFIAFRWPETYPMKTYAPMGGKASSGGGRGATR